MRPKVRSALALASTMTMAAALAGLSAGPALANYRPPSISLLCSAAANDTAEGTLCVLPPGQTTAPNAYSATITVGKSGTVGPTATFAITTGSLPPGLTLSAQGALNGAVTGNPTKAGTFNFTIKANDGGRTATRAYQITVTVQGPPDQLVCNPSVNGGFLENGVCVLPDAVIGAPYLDGHLVTSHQAGGTLNVVSGSLPPGLTLPAKFTGAADIVGGTATDPGVEPGRNFTVQGTGDQGQPLYQAYTILVDQNMPLSINTCCTTLAPDVGFSVAKNLFLTGGAGPYTWSLASGQLPPGLALQTFSDPRDANDELVGTPTTAGTYTFTMRVTDYQGDVATQQFTATINPPLQITGAMPAGTVGAAYSHDLIAQGGAPPYTWSIFANDPLPPGLTLGTTAPDFNNVLTGTPTQAGTFSFTVQVTDAGGGLATGTVTVTINP